jgi:N-acetylneuraminic acid mutarotase
MLYLCIDIWTLTENMTYSRMYHTASVLSDGTVLVIGGRMRNAEGSNDLWTGELYDPLTGTWTLIANMTSARQGHTASVLSNNTIVVVGGAFFLDSSISAELYNPLTDTWTTSEGRTNINRLITHTASVLVNGTVLVIGFDFFRTAFVVDLYHPLTNSWTPVRTMKHLRYLHTASVLRDGRVLIAGGSGEDIKNFGILSSAELYDPLTNTWTPTGNMTYPRVFHTASVLPNGNVLVAGGMNIHVESNVTFILSAELYDPVTGNWTLTGNITHPRAQHTSSVLPNGAVLVIGGEDDTSNITSSVELYDPLTGDWTSVHDMIYPRVAHTASVLLNGTLLVVGGYNKDKPGQFSLSSAELYYL